MSEVTQLVSDRSGTRTESLGHLQTESSPPVAQGRDDLSWTGNSASLHFLETKGLSWRIRCFVAMVGGDPRVLGTLPVEERAPTSVTCKQSLPKTSALLSVDGIRGCPRWLLVPPHFRVAELPAVTQSPQRAVQQTLSHNLSNQRCQFLRAPRSSLPGRAFPGWPSMAPGPCPLYLPVGNCVSK